MLQGALGETEIKNLGLMPPGDEDVGGLDVAMDDALCMSGVKRVGDLDSELEQAVQFQRLTVNRVLKGLALQQFHGDEVPALVFPDLIDGADVGMIKRGRGPGFTLETVECAGVFLRLWRQELEGDPASEVQVLGFVHYAHAAAAQLREHAIVRDGLPDHGERKLLEE